MIRLTKKLTRTIVATAIDAITRTKTKRLFPVTGKIAAPAAPKTAGVVAPNTKGVDAPSTWPLELPTLDPVEVVPGINIP